MQGIAVQAFEHKAFISWSWADAKWGNGAHRVLLSCRRRKAPVGQETEIAPVPRSLHPLSKDREKEAAGASIATAVEPFWRARYSRLYPVSACGTTELGPGP